MNVQGLLAEKGLIKIQSGWDRTLSTNMFSTKGVVSLWSDYMLENNIVLTDDGASCSSILFFYDNKIRRLPVTSKPKGVENLCSVWVNIFKTMPTEEWLRRATENKIDTQLREPNLKRYLWLENRKFLKISHVKKIKCAYKKAYGQKLFELRKNVENPRKLEVANRNKAS